MKTVFYSSIMGSLMYAQVCTRPDIAFVVDKLGRYLSERDKMKAVTYSSIVGSLMYAQVCTHPNIAFVVDVLGRYLSDPLVKATGQLCKMRE